MLSDYTIVQLLVVVVVVVGTVLVEGSSCMYSKVSERERKSEMKFVCFIRSLIL